MWGLARDYVCQISIFQLTHRNREQARSHKTPSPFAARQRYINDAVGPPTLDLRRL